ncbi:hypothetical protein YPF_4389 [Yersinia pestis biovar Orientalis str. India 195]|nr:hypothetical protein YP516_4021 [Yersinia pestis Nepal516]EEO79456.1 hypothetical protein YPF_4389 [Yersinia pestis biovar Orientalis str. India 195]EEO85738.1 hypothetical protein YPH_1607 [Yersinia pestis biovar Orientalis str. PEXU2]EEO91727.1 hypothetical protein YPS_0671 [Yersinia pestis Pestoides A]
MTQTRVIYLHMALTLICLKTMMLWKQLCESFI